ncbi:MAG: hypothetical protein KAH24_09015, partial [Holophagae bacterium]|nr:hypothetical protein [Holophagae bacterium]
MTKELQVDTSYSFYDLWEYGVLHLEKLGFHGTDPGQMARIIVEAEAVGYWAEGLLRYAEIAETVQAGHRYREEPEVRRKKDSTEIITSGCLDEKVLLTLAPVATALTRSHGIAVVHLTGMPWRESIFHPMRMLTRFSCNITVAMARETNGGTEETTGKSLMCFPLSNGGIWHSELDDAVLRDLLAHFDLTPNHIRGPDGQ